MTDICPPTKETIITDHTIHTSSERIGRFNAWFFDTFDGFIDWSVRRIKEEVYADLPDEIVEIGPGVGANFRYYQPGTRVIAIEPNLQMHSRLTKNARKAQIELDLRAAIAEDTGLPSDSAQVVISSLVFCTVVNPTLAAQETRRILKPGGRLLVIEHVRGRGPLLRALQRLVARPWKRLFDGCELGRDTLQELTDVGFDTMGVQAKTVATAFLPINSLVFGQATK